ncbi:YetF domain-containing protein [Clostridium luticellarii]|jgi:uncharacterized membrane protein YcaP (DUF421 family)|uniref:YetF C-terminal domain-containing protein n=1 Tax=Clostridium luticellarii TaxID=1691940 RepID=A0A2T0BQJ3_9CLOT|nr:DUF421 domain-containing protein [Clostridium luticellarii]MCI1944780.1 DUF421 domain-containing protein [Clostridium luticellarii]MCI1968275.1 DUF421 domain-containing protein [Clostridium luticellarii]MCI1995688.1 DUF421 domain-containing protein [Clostridium luticellarii]MCI2040232.1 DUF421 domain-containing protein [Clostridium luticellarii]PRR86150.1 hypothetical protein CLLU_07990 [Clostridium luticellarii]
MFTILFRTIILYLFVVISMRLMGKKQIGEMEPFELAIAIMISELASLPMQDTRVSITHGIIPIITLLSMQTLLAVLQLKSEKMRLVFSGKPSILINKGKLDLKKLKDDKFNINNLMEELRMQGYYNLSDIEYAILETSGQLSVIPKTELSPATKQDLKIKPPQEGLPVTLILDGKINFKNLITANKDENWLNQMMKKNSISSVKDVLVAVLDSKGKFYCQLKEKNE